MTVTAAEFLAYAKAAMPVSGFGVPHWPANLPNVVGEVERVLNVVMGARGRWEKLGGLKLAGNPDLMEDFRLTLRRAEGLLSDAADDMAGIATQVSDVFVGKTGQSATQTADALRKATASQAKGIGLLKTRVSTYLSLLEQAAKTIDNGQRWLDGAAHIVDEIHPDFLKLANPATAWNEWEWIVSRIDKAVDLARELLNMIKDACEQIVSAEQTLASSIAESADYLQFTSPAGLDWASPSAGQSRQPPDVTGIPGDGSDSNHGLGPLLPGDIDTPRPDPPSWHPPDKDSGEWGSRPANPGDYVWWKTVDDAAAGVSPAWPNAAANLLHYLDNTGTTMGINVNKMINDMPRFATDIQNDEESVGKYAIAEAKAAGATGPVTFQVRTAWKRFYSTKEDSPNWYYATAGGSYSLTGKVVVYPPSTSGGDWRYKETVSVSYRDRYNWDAGSNKQTTFGPITITDAQMNELRLAGLAENFNITGESSKRTYQGVG